MMSRRACPLNIPWILSMIVESISLRGFGVQRWGARIRSFVRQRKVCREEIHGERTYFIVGMPANNCVVWPVETWCQFSRFEILSPSWDRRRRWDTILRTFWVPWNDSSEGRPREKHDRGPNISALGKVLGRFRHRRVDIMAGDSTLLHSLGEREVHGDGYEILGKNTVEYSCTAPCLEGEHTFREKAKWVDFWTRRESWCWSDRSVDFHTPRYLDGWRGGGSGSL